MFNKILRVALSVLSNIAIAVVIFIGGIALFYALAFGFPYIAVFVAVVSFYIFAKEIKEKVFCSESQDSNR